MYIVSRKQLYKALFNVITRGVAIGVAYHFKTYLEEYTVKIMFNSRILIANVLYSLFVLDVIKG